MPAELLKFRCYRCNQLLAVASSRAGSVVACPRCKAELQIPSGELVPKEETEKPARRHRAGSLTSNAATSRSNAPEIPTFLAEIAAAIPPEVAELRPEDLRVEADVFESITREPAPPPTPPLMPQAAVETPAASPLADRQPELTPSELSNLFAPTPQTSEPAPALTQPSPVSSESRAFVPPIEIEPPSILAAGTEIRRSLEVILPASVVLAWSLFVLLGIALSFVAGLMVGHFLWKVH
jgi:phage FluMu protein Com